LKSKRRRRYKKKKYDFILISKIALICYLAIFGLGYLTSDTSAFFSSQSEVSETITAGIWEVPEVLVNACGEEYTIDEVTGEEILVNPKENDENPTEANEDELDCEAKDDIPEEIVCEGEDGSQVGDATSSDKVDADCENKDDVTNEEIDKDKELEDVEPVEPLEPVEPVNEKQNEVENGNNEENKENTNNEDPDNSNEEVSTKQPDDKSPADKDTTKDKATESSSDINKITEMNDAVKQEINVEKVEGDTNEI